MAPFLQWLGRLDVVVGVAKDGFRRFAGLEVPEDDWRALLQLVELGRKPVRVHHVPDQGRALSEPHTLRRDGGLPHEALQVSDALLGVGVDPVVDGLHGHGADSWWERATSRHGTMWLAFPPPPTFRHVLDGRFPGEGSLRARPWTLERFT